MVGQTTGFANVNFDYNGPPVTVTNKMVLDLVSQFGIQNAWYAFLKLRGLTLSASEDADKALAVKRFRNKIRQLKRSREWKAAAGEEAAFLEREFNASLIESAATGGGSGAGDANAAEKKNSESASADDDEDDSDADKDDLFLDDGGGGKLIIDEDAGHVVLNPSISTTVPQPSSSSSSNTTNNSTPTNPMATTSTSSDILSTTTTTFSNTTVNYNTSSISIAANIQSTTATAAVTSPKTTTGSVVTAVFSSAAAPSTSTTAPANSTVNKPSSSLTASLSPSSADDALGVLNGNAKTAKENCAKETQESKTKSHQETIDEVVSTVMEKIRNNLPFEGETKSGASISKAFSATSSGTTATSSSYRSAGKPRSRATTKKAYADDNSSRMVTSLSGGIMTTSMASPPPSSATAQQHHYMGQAASDPSMVHASSMAHHHQQHASVSSDQVTILSNFTEIIRASTSSTQQHQQQHISGSHLTPVTKIITQSSRGADTLGHHHSPPPQQQQQQLHHQHQIPLGGTVQFPTFTVPLSSTGTIPIGISPQGMITLPNNITVQSLLQSLQQQNKKQQMLQLTQLQLGQTLSGNQPIQVHLQAAPVQQSQQPHPSIHAAPPPSSGHQRHKPHHQQQEILPDSSSQEFQHGGGGSSLFGAGGQNASSVVVSTAAPKKRQYTRRKGIVASSTAASPSTATIVTAGAAPAYSSGTSGVDSSKVTKVAPEEVIQPHVETAKTAGGKKASKASAKLDAVEFSAHKPEPEKKPAASGGKKSGKESLGKKSVATLNESAASTSDTKPTSTTPSTGKEAKGVSSKAEAKAAAAALSSAVDEKIEELQRELAKRDRQLNAERNKLVAQKKRYEKLAVEHEKCSDAMQLVQIDLACQKTDNNNLSAENIALKAELQKLRSKETPRASSITSAGKATTSRKGKDAQKDVGTPSASTSSVGGKGGTKTGVKRSAAAASKAKTSDAKDPTSNEEKSVADRLLYEEPIEYGRRQSKRVCAARNRFMYQMF